MYWNIWECNDGQPGLMHLAEVAKEQQPNSEKKRILKMVIRNFDKQFGSANAHL